MSERKWAWWSGPNNEYFTHGPFLTKEEAMAEAEANEDEGYYLVEATELKVSLSAARLINEQYEEDEDLFDFEHVEPGRRGNHLEADAELQALLDAWTEKWQSTFIPPNKFIASRNEEYIELETLNG